MAGGIVLLVLGGAAAVPRLGHLARRRASSGRSCWPRGGGALIWRQSQRTTVVDAPAREQARPGGGAGRPRAAAALAPVAGYVALGAALIVGAALVFLWLNGALVPDRDVTLAVFVVVVALALILAPWWLRLARGLTEERAERIRTQERAEVAAHLHDSVLQTLALMQKRADDPREVAALARRQERELRAWLNDGARAGARRIARRLRSRPPWRRWRRPTACRSRSSRSATARWTTRGEALVAAAREAVAQRGQVRPGRRDQRLRRGARRAGRGVRARPRAGLRPRRGARRPPRRCASRCSGGWSATAAAPRSTRGPGEGTEVELVLGAMSAPRVVLVDDHGLFRAGVRAELDGLVDVVGDAGTVDEAIDVHRRARARRRAARRPDARRRRRRGDPRRGAAAARRCASSRSASPTRPRT